MTPIDHERQRNDRVLLTHSLISVTIGISVLLYIAISIML